MKGDSHMPFPRFRIRTLMIAVAVVALDLAAFAWTRRPLEQEGSLTPFFAWVFANYILNGMLACYINYRIFMRALERRAEERAARRPWLSEPSDPPPS